ncbi:MAG: hypothetical protein P4M07_27555 [Xanthobacteraceae bacterium]|nr:hypothetical protein [Xanthobacteraceae bacterium]
MTARAVLAVLATMLALPAARADVLPTPDRGPPVGSAAGLEFRVEAVEAALGPPAGPHYTKRLQVVMLAGCEDGRPNCKLARARNLIGMEVLAVDGQSMRPERGMVQEILDVFAAASTRPVTLRLYARGPGNRPVTVEFAR